MTTPHKTNLSNSTHMKHVYNLISLFMSSRLRQERNDRSNNHADHAEAHKLGHGRRTRTRVRNAGLDLEKILVHICENLLLAGAELGYALLELRHKRLAPIGVLDTRALDLRDKISKCIGLGFTGAFELKTDSPDSLPIRDG